MAGSVDAVLAFANSQLGQPYLWGGEGNGGFDCSGLVQAAFRTAGVALPRTAQEQYAATSPVPRAAAQVGDLVFAGTPSNVHHVGIYLGNNKMLDAPHTGAQVRVESLDGWDILSFGRASGVAPGSAGASGATATASSLSSSPGGLRKGLLRLSTEGVLLAAGMAVVGLGVWRSVTPHTAGAAA